MEPEHKSQSIGANSVESNEGERRLLCSNKANTRSPSLEFNNNSLISEKMQIDTLARILVDIFLERKRHGNKQ